MQEDTQKFIKEYKQKVFECETAIAKLQQLRRGEKDKGAIQKYEIQKQAYSQAQKDFESLLLNKMKVYEAINNLHKAVEEDTDISERVRNFLISLGQKHEVDLGSLCSLDKDNFQAAITLFSTIRDEQRFDMWEKLHLLGYE